MLPLINSFTKCTDSAEACDTDVPVLSDSERDMDRFLGLERETGVLVSLPCDDTESRLGSIISGVVAVTSAFCSILVSNDEKLRPSIVSAQLRNGQDSLLLESSVAVVRCEMALTCCNAAARDRVIELGEEGADEDVDCEECCEDVDRDLIRPCSCTIMCEGGIADRVFCISVEFCTFLNGHSLF